MWGWSGGGTRGLRPSRSQRGGVSAAAWCSQLPPASSALGLLRACPAHAAPGLPRSPAPASWERAPGALPAHVSSR